MHSKYRARQQNAVDLNKMPQDRNAPKVAIRRLSPITP